MTCGVYIIAFGKRCYVGSSLNIEQRWVAHRSALRLGKHHSRFMQRVFNSGEEPVFRIVEVCGSDVLLSREQEYINRLAPVLNGATVAGAPMTGRRHTPEARARMAKSPEQREAIAASKRGRKTGARSVEARQKARNSNPRKIAVTCVETDETFSCAGEAAEWLSSLGVLSNPRLARINISAARRGALKSAYGYTWR